MVDPLGFSAELGPIWDQLKIANEKVPTISESELIGFQYGARDRTRTYTGLPPLEPESSASTNSATRALRAFRPGAKTTRRTEDCNPDFTKIGKILVKYA